MVKMNTDILTYATIQGIVQQNDPDETAARIHGALTGLLCVQGSVSLEKWLEVALDEGLDLLDDESRAALQTLYRMTCHEINEPDFSFRLFLPDDDYPLSEQISALGEWCYGFLHALGYTSRKDTAWPGDTEEILNDFLQICRITCSPLDEENDLVELTEYVRICSQVVRTEFMQWRQSRRVH